MEMESEETKVILCLEHDEYMSSGSAPHHMTVLLQG